MAFSYTKLNGNGSNREFAIPFDYLSKDHVEVRVGGVLKTVITHYIFLTASTIQFTVAETPPSGTGNVELRRNTPKTIPFVDYSDGAALHEVDLDNGLKSVLFISQEAFDFATDIQAGIIPGLHAVQHNNGGADEINVAGLSGELADLQPPKLHAAAHQSGGGDAIKLDDLAAPDDNTDLNVSTTKHGLTPKLPNDATKFFDGVGAYTVPPAGGSPFNYTFNGDFEIWGAGAAAAPTSYAISGAGATIAKDTSNKKVSLASAALTRSGTDCILQADTQPYQIFHGIDWWKSKTVTFGCWVRATVASRARISIHDGVDATNSAFHTGGSAWEFLTVTKTLSGSASGTSIRMEVVGGDTTAQFDGAIFVIGSSVSDFVPSGWRGRKCVIFFGTGDTLAQASTFYLHSWGHSTGSTVGIQRLPYPKAVVRRLIVRADSTPGAGQTFVYTVRRETTDTVITATVSGAASSDSSDVANEKEWGVATGDSGHTLDVKLVTSATAAATSHGVSVEVEEIP